MAPRRETGTVNSAERKTPRMRSPQPLLCAATLTVAAAISSAAAAPAAAAPCRNAEAAPGEVSDAVLRRALRCVVNAERGRQGLHRLRGPRALGDAARGHARDMVTRGYFAHERKGSTSASRLRDAGWDGLAAGEAIAWGCGGLGEPRAIVDAWLDSPPHREILLGRYRRMGVGVAAGAPYATDCPRAATWVLVAGRN
jgi:uncharacterized protein YkwD